MLSSKHSLGSVMALAISSRWILVPSWLQPVFPRGQIAHPADETAGRTELSSFLLVLDDIWKDTLPASVALRKMGSLVFTPSAAEGQWTLDQQHSYCLILFDLVAEISGRQKKLSFFELGFALPLALRTSPWPASVLPGRKHGVFLRCEGDMPFRVGQVSAQRPFSTTVCRFLVTGRCDEQLYQMSLMYRSSPPLQSYTSVLSIR